MSNISIDELLIDLELQLSHQKLLIKESSKTSVLRDLFSEIRKKCLEEISKARVENPEAVRHMESISNIVIKIVSNKIEADLLNDQKINAKITLLDEIITKYAGQKSQERQAPVARKNRERPRSIGTRPVSIKEKRNLDKVEEK
jgi:hypothetical protein